MTSDDITRLHVALHTGCRLPALAMTISDQSAWEDFLREMRPLDDSPGGPFTVADIVAVLAEMRRLNEKEGACWSLRPTSILRDPEKFRDLVLIARHRLRKRPPTFPRAVSTTANTTINRLVDDPPAQEPDHIREACAQQLADFKARERGLSSPQPSTINPQLSR